ncbi:hypothetical protein Plhal703r1_c03g0019281 [Plasmopara halstedii]
MMAVTSSRRAQSVLKCTWSTMGANTTSVVAQRYRQRILEVGAQHQVDCDRIITQTRRTNPLSLLGDRQGARYTIHHLHRRCICRRRLRWMDPIDETKFFFRFGSFLLTDCVTAISKEMRMWLTRAIGIRICESFLAFGLMNSLTLSHELYLPTESACRHNLFT